MSDQQSRQVATTPQPFSNVPATQQSRAVFLPANLAQAMELAHFMAGGIGVRQWMRGNPSACLALIQISMRWGMDPYIVSNKAYYANDTLSFEAQLVNAVLNTCGELIGRLKVEFEGEIGTPRQASGNDSRGGRDSHGRQQQNQPDKRREGETLVCRVSGRVRADPEQLFTHEQELRSIKIRNSPLWEVNPRQQLQYYTTRAWARLYLPEVLLGIYTPDEIADGVAQRIEDESTPRGSAKAPDRRDFAEPAEADDADFTPIETVVVEEPAEEEPADGNSAAVDAAEETADIRGDDPVAEEHADCVASDGASGDVQAVEQAGEGSMDVLDNIPTDPTCWGIWLSTAKAAIGAVETRKQFDGLRYRIAPALEKATPAVLDEIQDMLTERMLELPEDKK